MHEFTYDLPRNHFHAKKYLSPLPLSYCCNTNKDNIISGLPNVPDYSVPNHKKITHRLDPTT